MTAMCEEEKEERTRKLRPWVKVQTLKDYKGEGAGPKNKPFVPFSSGEWKRIWCRNWWERMPKPGEDGNVTWRPWRGNVQIDKEFVTLLIAIEV